MVNVNWYAYSHFRQCTPYTKMSKDSLLFSFAKFLELKFYSETYGTRYQGDQNSACTHSVHKDYVQYFLHKDKLAAFQYVHTLTHTPTHALTHHTYTHTPHIHTGRTRLTCWMYWFPRGLFISPLLVGGSTWTSKRK